MGRGLTPARPARDHLLPPEAQVLGRVFEIRAKRIDVEPATTIEPRINRQCDRPASRPDIHEHSLDAIVV